MVENQLTAKIDKISLWKKAHKGFFFTTNEGLEFFAHGTPEIQVGQVVTFLIDDDDKLKEARRAEILRVEQESDGTIPKPSVKEVAEAFAGVKQEVKDAKALVQEAIANHKPLSASAELLKEWKEFNDLLNREGDMRTNREFLFLAYRMEKLERAIIDYGFGVKA